MTHYPSDSVLGVYFDDIYMLITNYVWVCACVRACACACLYIHISEQSNWMQFFNIL